jgi:hypothetical protein
MKDSVDSMTIKLWHNQRTHPLSFFYFLCKKVSHWIIFSVAKWWNFAKKKNNSLIKKCSLLGLRTTRVEQPMADHLSAQGKPAQVQREGFVVSDVETKLQPFLLVHLAH